MKVFNWEFLNEPLWRWFVWLVVMSLFAGLWRIVLLQMKGGA